MRNYFEFLDIELCLFKKVINVINIDSIVNEIIIMCFILLGSGNLLNGVKGKLIGIGIFC